MNDAGILIKVAAIIIGACWVLGLTVTIIKKVIAKKRKKEAEERLAEEKARLTELARQYMKLAIESRSLPAVESSFLLAKGERAYWEERSTLHESRTVRNDTRWKEISAGTLCVTNKRILFNGTKDNRFIKLANIIAVYV